MAERPGKAQSEPLLKAITHAVGQAYIKLINRSEFEGQQFKRHNERPIEFAFVFDKIAQLKPKTVLDVGSGTTALPSLIANCGCVVTATDNVKDYWPDGMLNKHWHIINNDIRTPMLKEQFDLVTCISVIEHIEDHVAAFRGLVSMAKPGGHIIVTTPYSERSGIPNVYALQGAAYGENSPYICRSNCRNDLDNWLACGANLIEQQFWRFWSGEVWTQGKILPRSQQVLCSQSHQLSCILFQRP